MRKKHEGQAGEKPGVLAGDNRGLAVQYELLSGQKGNLPVYHGGRFNVGGEV